MIGRRKRKDPAVEQAVEQVRVALEMIDRYRAGDTVEPNRLIQAATVVEQLLPDNTQMKVYLYEGYRDRGAPGDEDRALIELGHAIRLAPDESMVLLLGELWRLRLNRFEKRQERSDIDTALTALEQVIDRLPDDEAKAENLGYLGRTYRMRYRVYGDPADIEASIAALTAAQALTEGTPSGWSYTSDVAVMLLARFDRDASFNDLDRAIELLETAIEAAPEALSRGTWIANLSSALVTRSEWTRSQADAEQAVAVAKWALHLAGRDTDRTQATINLAVALSARARRQGGGEYDRQRATTLLTEDLDLLDARDPGRSAALQSLATLHAEGYNRSGVLDDLDRAIALRRKALAILAPDSPNRILTLADLGANLRARYERTADPDDLRDGLAALREAMTIGLAARTGSGLHAGRRLSDWEAALQHWAEAARVGAEVLAAHTRQYLRQATPTQRKAWLKVDQKLAGRVAVAYVHCGDPNAAVLVLEEARTRLMAEALGDSDPVSIRQIVEAAAPAPLLYLTSAPHGGAVIAVTSRGVTARIAPQLTEDLLMSWMSHLHNAGDRRGAEPERWRQAVDWTGEWLWEACVREALDLVGDSSSVVLVPCGPLTVLPLHAAWTSDPTRPSGRRYFLDTTLITYAPGVRALVRARTLAASGAADGLVAVEDPQPGAGPPLPYAAVEVGAACALWPDAIRLRGEQATRAAVTAALPGAGAIHLACHGRADITDPQAGGILLVGGESLTPDDVTRLDLRARIAVLSACETGVPGLDFPDEVTGLPSALLQAGVAATIATLWEVPDAGTALLMIEFYRRWRRDGDSPAAALRGAQQWLRDTPAGVLTETFGALLDGNGWLPAEAAQACWEQLVLLDPSHRPYAEPVGWAAFAFTGA